MANDAQPNNIPYFAVIFSSCRTSEDPDGYEVMANRMVDLARQQPGFLGIESSRDATGDGITVSYWADEAAIHAWRDHAEHLDAQRMGREKWYASFRLRIARVYQDRSWSRHSA